MRKLARAVFYILAAVVWCVLIGLALELYAGLKMRSVESSNRFVLQYKKDTSQWPRFDIDAAGEPITAGWEEVLHPGPDNPFTPDLDDHLGTFFAGLNEEDRATFAELREMVIGVYDGSGKNVGMYGTPQAASALAIKLEDFAGKNFAESPPAVSARESLDVFRTIFETGKPATLTYTVSRPGEPLALEMSCFPMKDAAGAVKGVVATWSNVTNLSLTERTARSQAVDNHPMWKRPYFEYRKNARVNKNWHTNNVGFRDGDVALPKPPEVFRIACLGGSATEEGLTNEVTYPHRVEQKLQAHFQDPHIEVINCGVVGLDILGERQRALEFALLEPDLVIQYNAGNDLCHALVPDWERQIGGWRKLLRRSRFAVRYWNRLVWPDSTTISEQIDRTMLANLATLHALLTRRGIAVAVCSFAHPDLGRLSREERDYFDWHARTAWGSQFLSLDTYCWLVDLYNEKVKAFCAEKGALYIPVAEELEGTTAHFGDIAHMRPTGIERKAEIVFEHLKTQIPGLRKHAAISPSP